MTGGPRCHQDDREQSCDQTKVCLQHSLRGDLDQWLSTRPQPCSVWLLLCEPSAGPPRARRRLPLIFPPEGHGLDAQLHPPPDTARSSPSGHHPVVITQRSAGPDISTTRKEAVTPGAARGRAKGPARGSAQLALGTGRPWTCPGLYPGERWHAAWSQNLLPLAQDSTLQ